MNYFKLVHTLRRLQCDGELSSKQIDEMNVSTLRMFHLFLFLSSKIVPYC